MFSIVESTVRVRASTIAVPRHEFRDGLAVGEDVRQREEPRVQQEPPRERIDEPLKAAQAVEDHHGHAEARDFPA